MATSYTALRDIVEEFVVDSSNATWSTARLDTLMARAFKTVGQFALHLWKVTLQVESRTGTANGDTASALVDSTAAQFVAGDVGKEVYNSTDKTRAVVTAYVSTSQLTLSKDIFPDGDEDYEIFNAGCTSNKQVNIASIPDYLHIRSVEYPVGTKRNFRVDGTILTLLLDDEPNDTADSDADKDVDIYFAMPHLVTQLTDVAGAVDLVAGYAAGSTSMVVDGLQATGTILTGQEFTIAGMRGTYRVSADATIAANEATISFYPGLESAVVNDVVVTFVSSTLSTELESILCNWASEEAMLKQSAYLGLNQMITGSEPFKALLLLAQTSRQNTIRDLERIARRDQEPARSDYSRSIA